MFADRDGTALLVIGAQVGIVAGAWDRDKIVARIAGLATRARTSGTPVLWIRQYGPHMMLGAEDWRIVPELVPVRHEPLIDTRCRDCFEDTDIDTLLADRGVGHVVICGARSDAGIHSTMFSAVLRGFDVTLVGDAHTTVDRLTWDDSLGQQPSAGQSPAAGVSDTDGEDPDDSEGADAAVRGQDMITLINVMWGQGSIAGRSTVVARAETLFVPE